MKPGEKQGLVLQKGIIKCKYHKINIMDESLKYLPGSYIMKAQITLGGVLCLKVKPPSQMHLKKK